ncbi:MAG: ribulose 1,5-bisphosphate carboxylase, partial [Quisquiliibacterium sp.]
MTSIPRDPSRIHAVYRVRCAPAHIEQRALALAAEQSVEMPLHAVRAPQVRDEIVGRVEAIAASDGAFEVTLSLSAQTVSAEAGQLLNMLFGNCSLQPDVELLDASLPSGVLSSL